ncbi:MAG: methyltransferase domain-containing protein [Chthoniobacterales bacterium]|nr:methyltransferase domain-containing protein [Chthoniobacterales bacterium]
MSSEPAYRHNADELTADLKSAEIVVGSLLETYSPRSVLDVGCGLGHFIRKFREAGVTDVLAVDGSYLDPGRLCIPQELFREADLTKPFDFGRKFDLVVSLEVAEHLPPSCASQFVDCLVRHGDVILFSAAFPGQGGQNHLNEQWIRWWAREFQRHGYLPSDAIRCKLVSSADLPPWYRFNVLLYAKPGALAGPSLQADFFEHVLTGGLGIKLSLRSLLAAVQKKFRRHS